MDVNALVQAVGSLGFPIVACGVMWYQLQKSEENHKIELDKLTDAIQNNTLVITKLYERMCGNNE